MTQMNLAMKQEQVHQHRRLGTVRGRRGGEAWTGNLGVSKCELSCTEWINHKILPYSMGNYKSMCRDKP